MECYPDPTLPFRSPSYPYFLDFVATPEPQQNHQNDNFAPPQISGPSQHHVRDLEDDVVRIGAYEHPLKASQQPFGTTELSFGGSGGIAAARSMPSPPLSLPRKRRPVASRDAQSKGHRLPVVGVFRRSRPSIARERSPLRAAKNTQNANFTAKEEENAHPHPHHKNAREQTRCTIIYKENRQGKLVIQKYSQRRAGSITAVRDKQQHTYEPPSVSQDHHHRGIRSCALTVPPASGSSAYQYSSSHNYLDDLYRAFKRDFENSSLPRIHNLLETINPQDLNLTMENSDKNQDQRGMEYYVGGSTPPPSNPLHHNVIRPQNNQQQRADRPQPGQQHVAMAHIINRGEDRGLASRINYDAFIPALVSKHKGNGHGVREFVELMNHERRGDVNHNHGIARTSSRFAHPALAETQTFEGDSRVSSAASDLSSGNIGGLVLEGAAEDGGLDDDMHTSASPRSASPYPSSSHSGNNNQNSFAFAPGEHLAHPHLPPTWWDGGDLTGFPIHLPHHSSQAQQALSDAYTLQPWYDAVVVDLEVGL